MARAVVSPPRRHFLELGLGLGGEAPRASPAIGGDGSTRQNFGDVALSFAIGNEIAPYASVLACADLGMGGARYTGGGSSWSTGLVDLAVAPGIRLHTRGARVRFYGGVAAGLDVRWVGATATGAQVHVSGSGVGLAVMTDAGLEWRLSTLYMNAGVALLLHDIGSVRDAAGEALFADGGVGRLGVRVALGYPF
jgi:hypothetical protein